MKAYYCLTNTLHKLSNQKFKTVCGRNYTHENWKVIHNDIDFGKYVNYCKKCHEMAQTMPKRKRKTKPKRTLNGDLTIICD